MDELNTLKPCMKISLLKYCKEHYNIASHVVVLIFLDMIRVFLLIFHHATINFPTLYVYYMGKISQMAGWNSQIVGFKGMITLVCEDDRDFFVWKQTT